MRPIPPRPWQIRAGTPGKGTPGTPGKGTPGTPRPGTPGKGTPGTPRPGTPGKGTPGTLGTPRAVQPSTRPAAAAPAAAPVRPAAAVRPALRPAQPAGRPPATAQPIGKPLEGKVLPRSRNLLDVKVEKQEKEPEKATRITVVPLRKDVIGINGLVGEYEDIGENHERRCYKKTGNDKEPDVFLYFWDERDGPDQSGWWFGNELGGMEVWARHVGQAKDPPARGWKVPWDNPNPSPEELIALEIPKPQQQEQQEDLLSQSKEELESFQQLVQPFWSRCTEALRSGQKLQEVQKELMEHQQAATTLSQKLQATLGEARRKKAPELGELNGLPPQLRALQAQLATELRKVKLELEKKGRMQVKVEKEAPSTTQTPILTPTPPAHAPTEPAHAPQEQAEEEVDADGDALVKDFEASVHATWEMADPMLRDPDCDPSAIEEVETSARELMKQLPTLRARLSKNQVKGPQRGPPNMQLRQKQLAATQALHGRLTEASKKLTPLQNFQKSFKERADAKKAMQGMEQSLNDVELEVEKVAMMLTLSTEMQMCEEEVQLAERLLKEAQGSLQRHVDAILKRLPGAALAVAEELQRLKKKGAEHQEKMNQLFDKIKSQRLGLMALDLVKEVLEKLAQAEEMFLKCSEAEMPFLKGIELLPKEESLPALQLCDAAHRRAQQGQQAAVALLRGKLAEVKKMAVQCTAVQDLEQLQKRADELQAKLDTFKKETNERRANTNMADTLIHVQQAHTAAQELARCAKICEKGLEAPLEDLKKVLEQAPKAQQELTTSMAAATKQLATCTAPAPQKQDVKTRMANISQESMKHRQAVAQASKLVKGKQQLEEQTTRTEQLEAQVAHLEEISSSPLEETEEKVMEEQKIMETLQKSLQASLNAAQLRANQAEPVLKTSMQKLLERQRKVHQQLTALQGTSKVRREKMLRELWQKGAEERVEKLQKLKAKAEELEAPFLTGLEVLPYKEATAAVSSMEEVAVQLEAGLADARSFIAAKSLACKAMGAGPQRERLLELSTRLAPLQTWLIEMRQNNTARRKAAQAHAAEGQVKALEKAVEALAVQKSKEEKIASCEERRAEVTAAEALAEAKDLGSKELEARRRTAAAQLRAISTELKELEREIMAGKLCTEVKQQLEEMDVEVQSCTERVQPALVAMPAVICEESIGEVLRQHLEEKGMSPAQLLSSWGSPVAPEKVLAEVQAMKPHVLSEEQRSAWLKDREALTSLEHLLLRCGRCTSGAQVEKNGQHLAELKPGDVVVIREKSQNGKELQEVELLDGTVGFAISKKEKLQVLPFSHFEFQCERFERLLQDALRKLQSKSSELTAQAKEVHSGPDEARAELVKLTPKLQVPVAALSLLQKQVAVAKRNFVKAQAAEKHRRVQDVNLGEIEEAARKLEQRVSEDEAAMLELQGKLKPVLESQEGPLKGLQQEAQALKARTQTSHEEWKTTMAHNVQKLKTAPVKLKTRLTTLSRRVQKVRLDCASMITSLHKTVEAMLSSMSSKVREALHSRKVKREELPKVLEELGYSEEQRSVFLESLKDLQWQELLQTYMTVQKAIAMTSAQTLSAKTVRKLSPSEQLEVLKSPTQVDGLARVPCRALRDGAEGWVTIEGNQGTSFLKPASKPYYVCTKEVNLDGKELLAGEVVELLQGPESNTSHFRKGLGKALKDQAKGWLTLSDATGDWVIPMPNLYKCQSAVALTVELGLDSKVTGRLGKGDIFVVEEGPTPTGELERLRGHIYGSTGSTASGWVTVRGNAGTVFLESCELYAVQRPVKMEKGRELQKDELLEVTDVKEEDKLEEQRVRVRSTTGQSGWLSMRTPCVKAWLKSYMAREPQSLEEDGKVLREVEKGEQLEALGLPSREEQRLKLRVKAKKDGAVGCVLVVRDKQQLLDF